MQPINDIGKDFPEIKRMRGRPKLLLPELETQFRSFVMEGQPATLRTVQNWTYFGQAVGVLCDGPGTTATVTPKNAKRFGWLLRLDETGGKPVGRRSIMYQLGRTKCPVTLGVFAEELCRLKPTATDGIRLIRHWQKRRDSLCALHLAENENTKITNKLLKTFAREAIAIPLQRIS